MKPLKKILKAQNQNEQVDQGLKAESELLKMANTAQGKSQ